MKALFLTFQYILPCDGISKKIIAQNKALKCNGLDIELACFDRDESGRLIYKIDDRTIETYGKGIAAKIKKRCLFGKLAKYISDNDIRFVYVRYIHFANPFFVDLFRRLRKNGTVIFLELPTYPYDSEYKNLSLRSFVSVYTERLCRRWLAKYVDRIVTFSSHDRIWNRPTVRISNGVDMDEIPVRCAPPRNSAALNLLGVAGLMFWHGFDRLIEGLHEYYRTLQPVKVMFNIVGGKPDSEIVRELKDKVRRYGLQEFVIFHGEMSGSALDDQFDRNDVAIGSLGCHRIDNVNVRPLKNREYAARGIPFVHAVNDSDFADKPYTLKFPADESFIDIRRIVDFYYSNSFDSEEIRKSVEETLSWRMQMRIVKKELMSLTQ